MNSLATLADQSTPVQLGWELHRARRFAAPAPGAVHLAAEHAIAEFCFDATEFEQGQALSDSLLCGLAESVGALRAEHTMPQGAGFTKLDMTFTYMRRPDPATGQVRVECLTTIDWAEAREQIISINGFEGRGLPLFSAEMRLAITPAGS